MIICNQNKSKVLIKRAAYNAGKNIMSLKKMKTILSLIAVGFLWGATNPFIKKGSEGIEKIDDTGSTVKNFLNEIKHIGTRLKYWIPFLLNQSGSVLFVWALQSSPLIVSVPLTNSLSFMFTAITGYLLGEKLPGKKLIIGTMLVSLGSCLMIYDAVMNQEEGSSKFEENNVQFIGK